MSEGGREGGERERRCKNLRVVRERECSSPCVLMYCSIEYEHIHVHIHLCT